MKEIPKLPKPKDLVELSQPDEEKLPKPDEKLLRAPTFSEKYGRFKLVIIAAILVAIIDFCVYYFFLR